MAKEKVEQELTVEEKLRALYELQTVNTKIDNLRILAGELPQEVKDMGDEIEGLKTRLTNIENGIKECETGISDHRVRIENANAAISRYKEQQNNVRNNREYDNLTKEIEYQELEIEASQRKINKFKEELETRQADKVKTVSEIEDKTVAICGGAGAEFVEQAIAQGADAYISADFKYHELQTAHQRIMVVDMDHWVSEHFTREIFEELLSKHITTRMAKTDQSPVKYYQKSI